MGWRTTLLQINKEGTIGENRQTKKSEDNYVTTTNNTTANNNY